MSDMRLGTGIGRAVPVCLAAGACVLAGCGSRVSPVPADEPFFRAVSAPPMPSGEGIYPNGRRKTRSRRGRLISARRSVSICRPTAWRPSGLRV